MFDHVLEERLKREHWRELSIINTYSVDAVCKNCGRKQMIVVDKGKRVPAVSKCHNCDCLDVVPVRKIQEDKF